MKRKWSLAIATLTVLLSGLTWWQFRPSRVVVPMIAENAPSSRQATATLPIASGTGATDSTRHKANVGSLLAMLATPITFYGKAVDQNGDPVPKASVYYSAINKFDEPCRNYQKMSDEQGNFTISGISGAVLNVGVRKVGYYMIDGKSAASFAYGVGPDATRQSPPSKDSPAIFVLQKMGMTEPLIVIKSSTYDIGKNGEPVEINLRTGQSSSPGNLRVEAWTQDQTPDENQHYNWRCRVSVPNGGLVERENQFVFEAPLEGYKPSDEIVVTKSDKEWQSQAIRNYFLKLPDGSFARVGFKMIAGGDHFFRLESYLNPKIGHRNLEFDPNQTKAP